MGIKDQFAAEQSKFISLFEALSLIIDKENVDLKTAARWLLHHDVMNILSSCYLTNTFNLIESNFNGNYHYQIWSTLNTIIDEDDDLPFGFELGSLDKGEYKSLGFFRDQFYVFMRENLDWDNFNLQPQKEVKSNLSYETYLLRKQSLFTIIDAACLISDDSVTEITRCQNDTNFDRNYSGFISASNFIESCIYANELDFNNGYISRESLISLFNKKDIIIDGFNDDIKNNKIPDTTEYNKFLAENTQLKQRIAELEQQLKQSQQPHNKPDKSSDIDLLAYILDSTQKNYAPDLALSIQLYKYVYIENSCEDSHSSKANTWIKQNTGYDSSSQSSSRIREMVIVPKNGNRPCHY